MAKSSNVTINILANGSKAQQQFRSVGDAASAMGRQIEGATRGIRGHLESVSTKLRDVGSSMMSAGAKMTAGLTLPIVAFGATAVKAFGEAQAAEKQLEDAFARFPNIADTNIAAINGLAEAQMKRSRFDDDSVKSGAAVLAQYGATGKQLQSLIPLVVDYAAKTGRDVPAAAEIVGKALQGKGRALMDVGIKYKDAKSEAANYDQVVKGLGASVRGYAEVDAATLEGRLEAQKVKFGELKESIGQALMPIMEKVAEVVGRVSDAFANLSPRAQQMIMIGVGVAAALGPLVTALGAMATVIGFIVSPIGLVIVGLAALAAAAVYAYQHFEGFRRVVDSVMSWLTTNVPAALSAVRNFFRDALDEIRAFWDRWGDDIERAASTALAGVKTVVGPVMNGIAATIKTTLAILKGDWRGAWDGIKAVAESGIKGAAAAIRLNASLMWEAAQQIMRAFKNGVLAIWTEVQAWFAGLGGKIKSAIGAAKDMLYSIGADIVQGLINGIKSKGSAVTTAIAGVVNPLAGAAKLILDSHSPSKVFHKIGEDISVGTANGITAKKQEAVDAAKKLAEESARAAADAVSSVMGAVSSSRGLESAQRELGNAEEDLAVVRARAATIADRIAAAERALAEAKAEAAKITAEEQVAIEQATEAYEKASEAYKKGEISAAELEVAEHKLAKAKSDAVGDTDDVRAAESKLKDLRDEEKRLTKDLTDAELRRRDAQDRLIDAQIRAYDSTQKLTGNGSTLLAMFMQLASQMGLTQAQIDAVTAAINNMPSGKTITITTVYQTQGTPANTGTGGNTGSTGQHDTVDMPGHHTPVSGHAAAMQVNVNLDSKVLATAMVSTLRTQGVVRPDGTLKVTH